MRVGVADLPLHYGKTPAWLFSRMELLAGEIITVIVKEYSAQEFLRRLADPFWFQAFGCCLGFDWHSSGLTTTVCAAIKSALKDRGKELGIFVAGGKGKTSRQTPQEIAEIGEKSWVDSPEQLIYASRLSAKVDNNALQDGYQLYHHSFFFTSEGKWAVVQQGMYEHWARRYHWLSEKIESFVCEPHSAIYSQRKARVLNMVAKESEEVRKASVYLACQKPEKVVKEIKHLERLTLPSKHSLSLFDIQPQNLSRVLLSTYERQPQNFEELLGIEGVGAKTVRALSLISELIYGTKVSTRDPARFSFAHGGKDGYPYKVERRIYDNSINFLREAILQAKLGHPEKLKAMKRLSKMSQSLSYRVR
ncbi:MAG: DUF763 domain-containing protein [Candidatus Omnitrophota bacterium]|nr:MAG: DUF763 domain-containing protein [Candidatus Omnitrophota bacterium]